MLIKNKLTNRKKNQIRLLTSLCLFIAIFFIIIIKKTYTHSHGINSEELQKNISEKMIRFHVIANSNSDLDQELKLKIKECIVTYLYPIMNECSSKEDAKAILSGEINNIINLSKKIIQENSSNYEVTATLDMCYFPIKSYGELVLPAGNYETLNIYIGNAQGKNWWCVMYPTLCFIDCTYSVLPDDSKKKLEDTLTVEEYDAVINDSNTKIKYKIKIIEILKNFLS